MPTPTLFMNPEQSALFDQAVLAYQQNDYGTARQYFSGVEEALRLQAAINPSPQVQGDLATVLVNLANLHNRLNQADEALAAYREAERLFRELAQAAPSPEVFHGLADLLMNRGNLHNSLNQPDAALAAYREADELLRPLSGRTVDPSSMPLVSESSMPTPPIKDKYLEELTTRDPNAEPHIAGLTKQNMTKPPQRGNRRLYNPDLVPASHPDRAVDNQPSPPIYLTKASRDLAITCDTESSLLLPTVSVRLRESTLTKVCGDYWLLYINVFVYRGEARTRIPAEIIDETEEEVDGEVYITFTLELEQWVIDALDVRLGSGVQSPQAGFSGTEGEGQLAVVIIQP